MIAPRQPGGRKRTGAIMMLPDGSLWVRVRYKDQDGRRREKRRKARDILHADSIREHLLAELDPAYVARPLDPNRVLTTRENLSIYCIQILDGGLQPIKLGIAKDVNERLRSLSTGAPYELKVLSAWPATYDDEQSLHEEFKHLRIRGEWFIPDADLMAYIEQKAILYPINVGKNVGEGEKMVPPARFQRATFRLGVGAHIVQEVADSRTRTLKSSLQKANDLSILSTPAAGRLNYSANPLAESVGGGHGMPRSKTGSVFQLKDGTWWARVSFKDEHGKRRERWRRAANKTDAKDKRDDLLLELKTQGVIAFSNDRVTFAELASYFENHYCVPAEYRDGRKIVGVRSPAKFKSALAPLKEFFGNKRLRSLNYGDLREYKLSRLRSKSKRDKTKQLSIATVNRELSVLRRMLSIARQQRWLIESPFKFGEPLITPADEKHRERVLSHDEETRLLVQCEGPREHLRGIVLCALDTGMRRGEILLLRWRDVGEMVTVQAMHTKTLHERHLGISVRLSVELDRLRIQAKPQPTDRVFGLRDNFKRSFKTACTNAKIEDLRFHDLRHTFATRLSEAGLSSELIARLLGHSQVRTTYRYLNITEETARRAVELLESKRQA